MQITKGIRSILANAWVYQAFQDLLGAHSRQMVVNTYIRPEPGQLLLDVGCGPGEIITHLPLGIQYIGVDLSQKYISQAQMAYGHLGQFICSDLKDLDFNTIGKPDIVLANGLLHHLEDAEVLQLFSNIAAIMKSNTRLITIDPCLVANSHPIARFVISRDRGQNVRLLAGYVTLAEQIFREIRIDLRDDLLRIPYNHIILECQDPYTRCSSFV